MAAACERPRKLPVVLRNKKKVVVFVIHSLGNVLMGLKLYLDMTLLLSRNGKACAEPAAAQASQAGAVGLGTDPAGEREGRWSRCRAPAATLPPAPLLLGQAEPRVPQASVGPAGAQ